MPDLIEKYNNSPFSEMKNTIYSDGTLLQMEGVSKLNYMPSSDVLKIANDQVLVLLKEYGTLLHKQSDYGKVFVNPASSISDLYKKVSNNMLISITDDSILNIYDTSGIPDTIPGTVNFFDDTYAIGFTNNMQQGKTQFVLKNISDIELMAQTPDKIGIDYTPITLTPEKKSETITTMVETPEKTGTDYNIMPNTIEKSVEELNPIGETPEKIGTEYVVIPDTVEKQTEELNPINGTPEKVGTEYVRMKQTPEKQTEHVNDFHETKPTLNIPYEHDTFQTGSVTVPYEHNSYSTSSKVSDYVEITNSTFNSGSNIYNIPDPNQNPSENAGFVLHAQIDQTSFNMTASNYPYDWDVNKIGKLGPTDFMSEFKYNGVTYTHGFTLNAQFDQSLFDMNGKNYPIDGAGKYDSNNSYTYSHYSMEALLNSWLNTSVIIGLNTLDLELGGEIEFPIPGLGILSSGILPSDIATIGWEILKNGGKISKTTGKALTGLGIAAAASLAESLFTSAESYLSSNEKLKGLYESVSNSSFINNVINFNPVSDIKNDQFLNSNSLQSLTHLANTPIASTLTNSVLNRIDPNKYIKGPFDRNVSKLNNVSTNINKSQSIEKLLTSFDINSISQNGFNMVSKYPATNPNSKPQLNVPSIGNPNPTVTQNQESPEDVVIGEQRYSDTVYNKLSTKGFKEFINESLIHDSDSDISMNVIDEIGTWDVTESDGDFADPNIINFYFEDISTESDNNKSIVIPFRASLTSFSDNVSAVWDGFRYMGRADQIYKYGGFDRKVDLGFDVAIGSKEELLPTWRKLNYLYGMCYPVAYNVSVAMKPAMMRLTIGSVLRRVHVIMNSITYTMDNTKTIWEIEPNYQLPMFINVTTSFTVLYDDTPFAKSNHFAQDTKWMGFVKYQENADGTGDLTKYDRKTGNFTPTTNTGKPKPRKL
jgi:hypothetical protein